MLDCRQAMTALETALEENPVAAMLGPRQCGKTTLYDGPIMTKSLHIALEDLKLERAWIRFMTKLNAPALERPDFHGEGNYLIKPGVA